MQLTGRDASENFLIALAPDEVILLANALNEMLLELDPAEFPTRTGATTDEAMALYGKLSELLGNDTANT